MKRHIISDGEIAPNFTATDVFGMNIRLSAYKSKHVLVAFMRYSACPWCNVTIHRLTVEYAMLKQNGCEVIVFMQSSGENIRHNIYDMHKVRPEYPIIPDPDERFYKLYGVTSSAAASLKSIKDIPHWLKSISELGFRKPEIDGNLLLVPAIFLIGPGEQKVIKAEYSASFYDHQTFTEIYEPLIFSD